MTDFVPEELLSMPEQRTGSWRDAETPARVDLVDVLFRRHYTAMLRLAVVMLGSREAADDRAHARGEPGGHRGRSARGRVAGEHHAHAGPTPARGPRLPLRPRA